MTHVDEGTLHALVDDQLDAAERAAVQAHLTSCGDCARRFADATAMARQVRDLLGALDERPVPVRVQPAVERPVAERPATPVGDRVDRVVVPLSSRRTPLVTLRRIALAASLLVVAGISYRVGTGRQEASAPRLNTAVAVQDSVLPEAAAMPPAVVFPASPAAVAEPQATGRAGRVASRSMAVVPADSAVVAARVASADRPVASAPVVAGRDTAVALRAEMQRAERAAPLKVADASNAAGASRERRASSVEARESAARVPSAQPAPASATGLAAPAPLAASQVAAAPRAPAAPAATAAKAGSPTAAPVLVSLAGYSAVEEQTLPAVTRRRYVSSAGTTLVLLIERGTAPPRPTSAAATGPEFTVRTVNGSSVVRWTSRGDVYELTGALPPDSLVKLATQLR